ncbi:uncharacterized protein EI90DRAFT_3011567 [Cantharellus anzutake]|uniref:uncharacterized protein n=1 Tax=Cantharellus anzutake TaxID=1750568 RepID=UPI0019034C25|nr:uncharacterized protein EI90DRAFT_3011567 [Cantharellus anzutake]KAF8341986.1 hypothetical protein EI90DRAFT_3011567 [Cantharellus anzutake]
MRGHYIQEVLFELRKNVGPEMGCANIGHHFAVAATGKDGNGVGVGVGIGNIEDIGKKSVPVAENRLREEVDGRIWEGVVPSISLAGNTPDVGPYGCLSVDEGVRFLSWVTFASSGQDKGDAAELDGGGDGSRDGSKNAGAGLLKLSPGKDWILGKEILDDVGVGYGFHLKWGRVFTAVLVVLTEGGTSSHSSRGVTALVVLVPATAEVAALARGAESIKLVLTDEMAMGVTRRGDKCRAVKEKFWYP